jgi:type I restriction enzyme S subunit
MSKLLEQINSATRTSIKLADAASRIGDGLHGTPIYDNQGEYYFINGNNLDNGYILIKKDTRKINYSEYLKHKKDLSERSLLLSINGTIGNLAKYRGEKCILGKSAAYVNIKNDFQSDYFYYVLLDNRFKKHITNNASGSTIKNVSLEQLREYEVSVPDLPTQKKIAEILSAYDAKIENNNAIIKNLEAITQTIFDEWFVNFHFPGYEKAKFVDSGMGEIPEGWEVKSVLDVIERISPGKKYENKTALPIGKVPILDQGASGFIGYHNDEPGVMASINNPVVVFTNHTCYYRILTEPFSCIQNVLPYGGKNGYDTFFVYFLTKEKIKMSEYKGHWPEFEQQIFVIPPINLTNQFSEKAKMILEKMVLCEKENIVLKETRDKLLAKLI